jgi:hypothetical protein
VVPSTNAAGLFDAHAFAARVAGAAREHDPESGWGRLPPACGKAVDGGQQCDQQVFARLRAAGGEAQRGGFGGDLGRKGRVIDVHSEAGDGYGIDQLHQDAGGLAIAEHDVVGPAQIGVQVRGARDGLRRWRGPAPASGPGANPAAAAGAARRRHTGRRPARNARNGRDGPGRRSALRQPRPCRMGSPRRPARRLRAWWR